MAKKPVTKLVGLSIHELSLVDNPANGLSRGFITKRDMSDVVDEITKRIEAGDEPTGELKEYLSKEEGDTTEKVSKFVMHCQHSASCVSNVTEVEKYFNATEENSNMSEELKKKAEGLEAQVAELTAKLEKAESVAKLTEREREYMASLDEQAAEEFRAAAKEKRDAMMKKSADSDEVFKSAEGHEIRKSAVGDGVFAILKSQDEALRSTREEMVKAADRAMTVEFTKRADEEFKNLPGETASKVAVLKGINGMDEATQATLTAMLKAGNDALAKGFNTFGVQGGKSQDITKSSRREALIAKLREADPALSYASAETKVLSANPDLYEG